MLCGLKFSSFRRCERTLSDNIRSFSLPTPITRKTRNVPVVNHKPRDLGLDVKHLQKQVLRSIEHMMKDEEIEINWDKETLMFRTTRGKYWLYPNYGHKALMFQSWNTVLTSYNYYPEENVWLTNKGESTGDTHDFRDMFTRDVARYHVGCPDFNFPDCNQPGYYMYPVDEDEEATKLLGGK